VAFPVRASRLVVVLAILCVVAACADPPEKELHQAQGAIDAARAAGADQYAPEEYKAAVDALDRANAAVTDRDYRLALNNALDSRERAQNAAKMAADQKAATRSEAERLLAEVTSAIAVASARLQAADAARTPKAVTDPLRAGLAAARQATDDTGKALATQDYLTAAARLQGVGPALSVLMQQVPAAPAPTPAKPTRRRR
jgi:flagellar hook-basal body complex protein FliE